ncbi:MAG: ABC transporter permease, partial [Desulfurococcales archaeon]|nr:ABC transporter permease [Desulfurococcales archaeon]
MSNSLLSLISKETKEMLRDPRIFILMIVAPILIFILLGTVMGYATEKTVEATASGLKIAVIDEDGGEASKALIQFLRSFPDSTVDVFTSYTDPKALLLHGSYDVALVIQPNFTSNILFGREAQISSYEMVRDLSISAGAKLSSLPSMIGAFQQQILLGLIAKAYPQFNITSLSHMISLNETAILGGREYSMSTVNSLLTGSILLVLAPIMVFSIGTSLAASSMGIEKEEKTLEIL